MTKYKRIRGKTFVVDYPAALWNGLSTQEQTDIVNFYNQTYGKATGVHGRAYGPANGRYSPGRN